MTPLRLARPDEVFYEDATTALFEANRQALFDNHSKLVDKRFLHGLTADEDRELVEIERALDELDDEYYKPMRERLEGILKRSNQ